MTAPPRLFPAEIERTAACWNGPLYSSSSRSSPARFTGIARGAATIAKVIFFVFLAIFVVMLILAVLGISLIV